MNNFKSGKLFKLCLAVSSVVIILGIILYAVFGFNLLPERPERYTFEVSYDVIVELNEKEDDLAKLCEDTFAKYGISYIDKDFAPYVDSSAFTESTNTMLVYTFAKGTSAEALANAKVDVNAAVQGEVYQSATIYADWHAVESARFYEFAWRGAIALAVGAIAAFAYICIRYGVSIAVAGFACCAHDALLTAALFAITRFPVYAATPLLYAAIAALVSIVLWLVYANKLRAAFKAPESASLPSEEVIWSTSAASCKAMLFAAALVGVAVLLIGLIAVGGTMLFVLPALVGVAIPLYSTMFIGPAVCAPIKKAFVARKAKKKGGYVGKKKAEVVEE